MNLHCYYSIAMTLCLGLLFNFVQAQGVQVISQTESFTQATYQLRIGNKQAQATIRKQQGKVSILLKSNNGTVLGKATIKNDGNGKPLISIHEARTGTHAFWVFALDRIIPDGNSTSLSPRQKAYRKCKDKCKGVAKNHAGIRVLSVNGHKVVPAADLAKVAQAYQIYQRCMWECMHEARDRYQGH